MNRLQEGSNRLDLKGRITEGFVTRRAETPLRLGALLRLEPGPATPDALWASPPRQPRPCFRPDRPVRLPPPKRSLGFAQAGRLMAASAHALLLFVPVASDAAASSEARASARRPRLARSTATEEVMRMLSKIELSRMTRLELLALLRQAATELAAAPERSPTARTGSSTCARSVSLWLGVGIH
jgi:hypothetical protein